MLRILKRVPMVDGETAGRGRGVSRRAGFVRIAALWCCIAALAFPGAADAHDKPDHSLTVRVATATPLPSGARLCVSLFPGGEGALSEPKMGRCLGDGASEVLLDGLPHGTYRVVVPGAGSTVDPTMFEGQIVITEIPDEPSVADFVVDVVLAEAIPVTGGVSIDVYGCPVGTDLESGTIALGLACRERDAASTFALTAGDTAAASAGSIVAEAVGGATARVTGVTPGRYGVVSTAGIATDAAVAWFLLPADDGIAAALGATPSVEVAADRDTRLAVFVVEPSFAEESATTGPATIPGRDPAPMDPNLALGGAADPTVAAPPSVTPSLTLPNTGTGDADGPALGVGSGLAVLAIVAAVTVTGYRRRRRA